MLEIDNFYNSGFGWICRRCERELVAAETPAPKKVTDKLNRIMREGEAESKQPRLSNLALARWLDAAKTTLVCPRCHITERVDKA